MRQLIYDPVKSGERMKIVCLVSGSGTNYREIAAKNPRHQYLVFTNRPGCGGTEIARLNRHPVIELSHIPYLKEARKKYGAGNVPRNCPERIKYYQDASALIEQALGGQPDLLCPAGFDQWTADWLVDRYYPRILNVHPGDTTKDYDGLHWIPSAKAIIAGGNEVRSTLFIVDQSEDKGPVILQSRPVNIEKAVKAAHLADDFKDLVGYLRQNNIVSYNDFRQKADEAQVDVMSGICSVLQNQLKEQGDWEIYPLAVQMIAAGRVAVNGRQVYLDGALLPEHGCRLG